MPTDNTLQHPVRALHKCYINVILCKLSVVYNIYMTFLENHPSGAVCATFMHLYTNCVQVCIYGSQKSLNESTQKAGMYELLSVQLHLQPFAEAEQDFSCMSRYSFPSAWLCAVRWSARGSAMPIVQHMSPGRAHYPEHHSHVWPLLDFTAIENTAPIFLSAVFKAEQGAQVLVKIYRGCNQACCGSAMPCCDLL